MKHVRLVAHDDGLDTTPGLLIKGTPTFEGIFGDREGGLIAHDLLEHQNGAAAIGGVADELEAMGGLWQVRGRWGDMGNQHYTVYSPEQNTAAEIERMANDMEGHDYWPGSTFIKPSRPHDHDDEFHAILDCARKNIMRQMGGTDGVSEDFPVDAYLTDALHLMRRGFRKAQRRFGTDCRGFDLFMAVKEAVRRARPEWEGQEFRLSYGRGTVRCVEITMESEW